MAARILILDDDNDLLELICLVLGSRQYQVESRNECRNIVQIACEIKPDIILMDNWIPDMGGVKATQLLKASRDTRHIPVIFFSAHQQIAELAREAGADFFLQKPFEVTALENSLNQASRKTAVY